jgi:hypothetical protein
MTCTVPLSVKPSSSGKVNVHVSVAWFWCALPPFVKVSLNTTLPAASVTTNSNAYGMKCVLESTTLPIAHDAFGVGTPMGPREDTLRKAEGRAPG